MQRNVAESILGRPRSPVECRLVEPGLVDVDDPRALIQELEHLKGILLAEYSASIRIGFRRELLSLDESQLAVLAQHLPHELVTDIEVFDFIDGILYHLSTVYYLLLFLQLPNCRYYGFLLFHSLFLPVFHSPELLWLFLGVNYEIAHQLGRDPKSSRDLFLRNMVL